MWRIVFVACLGFAAAVMVLVNFPSAWLVCVAPSLVLSRRFRYAALGAAGAAFDLISGHPFGLGIAAFLCVGSIPEAVERVLRFSRPVALFCAGSIAGVILLVFLSVVRVLMSAGDATIASDALLRASFRPDIIAFMLFGSFAASIIMLTTVRIRQKAYSS